MIARMWACVLVPALIMGVFSGCFTEVGNAEDEQLVSGRFEIDYASNPQPLPKSATSPASTDPDSISIRQFYLEIREAEFQAFDSVAMRNVERHLWKKSGATLPVDFTGEDASAALPIQKMDAFKPDNFVLQCLVPKQSVLKPDTLDFLNFSGKGYIKGYLYTGQSATPFLFQLPENQEIHLEYSAAALLTWYRANEYHCEFVFFATKWMEGAGLGKAVVTRDRSGAPLIILGNGHNAALYALLVERFYKSFNTQRVFAEVGR
ncbi:MAG: hypothetical protein ABIW76_14725 [Fibrobacteria bacterium]